MKKIILEVLASKGPVSEKKLRKYSLKAADSDESEFDSALSSLLKKNKVVLVDDTYSLPAATAEPKRKRSDSDVKETVTEEPKVVAAEEQPTKKAKKEKQVAAPSKWQYEELWKNGEKHWRDGTFDPEYLRTNPDK